MTSRPRILLVEDDHAIATVVRVALEGEGFSLDAVDSIGGRDAALLAGSYAAIITDVMLPDGNGMADMPHLVDAAGAALPTIVLSAQNTLDTAVRAAQQGAFDYLPKPFDLDELVRVVRAATQQEDAPAGGAIPATDFPIIGRAPAMQQVYRTLARVAPTDLTVLVLGESGTGKELVAQAIHASSRRRTAPFVAVNMAAIPRELIESELFGHERGAFTGAVARGRGRFEQADGGTLFLDEIGDMPLDAQTRLLRVLQTGDYSPVGSARVLRADVRIVAATNGDLAALVASGRFREDLFYRLNVIPIDLPPLRDRRSDIALLATHFLDRAAADGLGVKRMSAPALAELARHAWPGNVRQLANAVQRLVLLTRGTLIGPNDVALALGTSTAADADESLDPDAALAEAVRLWLDSEPARAAADSGDLHDRLVGLVERTAIDGILTRTGGNQLRAAAQLGINRNTLRVKRSG